MSDTAKIKIDKQVISDAIKKMVDQFEDEHSGVSIKTITLIKSPTPIGPKYYENRIELTIVL
jgi:hypothetical protein